MCKRLKFLLLVGSFVLFASCGKKHSPPNFPNIENLKSNERAYTETLSAESVSSQGCLNAGLFFGNLSYINPASPLLVVPTELSFSPAKKVRENFKKFVAYGQMRIFNGNFSQLDQFPVISQEGCEKFIVKEIDGTEKEFAVSTSTSGSLVGEASDGEAYAITWLSDRSVKIKHTYLAYDMPCSTESDPIKVSITKSYDWSVPAAPLLVPDLPSSSLLIDPAFLAWAAASVMEDPKSYYVEDELGAKSLDLQKVGEIAQKDPDPSLLSCGL